MRPFLPTSFIPSAQRNWSRIDGGGLTVWAVGHAFSRDALLSGEAFALAVHERLLGGEAFEELLRGLSGQFALAALRDGELRIASDPIRSVPLFYLADGSAASDDVHRIADRRVDDLDSLAEFSLAGFVTGPYTLLRGVRTLQAGETVRLRIGESHGSEWCELRNTYEDDAEDEGVLRDLDDVVMGCMERAARVAGGRQVLIPLSGGLDSRLVLSSFKRLGYANMLCYSYGLSGNWEAGRAREKAAAIGVEWMELPFTPESLRDDLTSPEMRRFWHMASQAYTLPSVPDWPGMRLACESGRVDPDALVLSGQSGDFLNGSHLKYLFDPEWRRDPLDVAGAVRAKHYSLWRDLAVDPGVRSRVDARIAASLASFAVDSPEGAARAYEFWECRERQIKYVVQGGRVFEFFGHEWWMPLWDRALIDFFRTRSIGLKLRGYLYAKYVASIDPLGLFRENMPRARFDRAAALAELERRRTPWRRFRGLLAGLPGVHGLAQRRALHREHRHYYRHNPLGFPRVYSEEEYTKRDLAKRHVLSLWLRDVLREEYGVELGAVPGLLRGTSDA